MKNQSKAFTLVELIVVITILAILGTIAFLSYQGYSKSARDSRRISDIGNLKTSLGLFQLKVGKYPIPDYPEDVTYSGAVVWSQGVISDGVFKNLTNINKKPIDPLTDSEYTYSLLNTKKEFQIGGILEGSKTTYINISNETYAAGTVTAQAYITGDYNGIVAKVSTGSLTYVLAVPSIISSEVGDLQEIIDNSTLIYDGYKNLPKSYSGTTLNTNGEPGLILTKKLLAYYSGTLDSLKNPIDQKILVTNLQTAYTGTQISYVGEIKNILDINTSNQTSITNLVANITNNNAGGLPNLGLKNLASEPDSYTITFDANGGTLGTSSVIATIGSAMPTLAIAPTKPSYDFTGYFTLPSGGIKYYNDDKSSATNWDLLTNTTLYAQWETPLLKNITFLAPSSRGFFYVKNDGVAGGWGDKQGVNFTNVGKLTDGQGGNTYYCKVDTSNNLSCFNASSTDFTTTGIIDVNVVASGAGGGGVVGYGCLIKIDGSVRCWGYNSGGQLGNGTSSTYLSLYLKDYDTAQYTPTGLTSSVTKIAISNYGPNCVIQSGAAKCWHGYPGDGTTVKYSPVQVTGLTLGVTDISVGDYHGCAIKDGGVWCWGTNAYGQLGNGGITTSNSPIIPNGMNSGITSVAVSGDSNYGGAHTCVVKDGGVWCWGRNNKGQLGNGNTNDSNIPVQVIGLTSGVSKVFAGGKGGTGGIQRTCALLDTGKVKCWGDNYGNPNNALGSNNPGVAYSSIPLDVIPH